ncbi:putative tubulin--tyrosine ligase pby1 [Coniosporium tulheliwenetii]|uniref:Tubulin--tyrosine ligase pby1 n=1 Tax=Coniosporium tulheliwenetii TaxID=3383036 RepID=A0ACC2ZPV6_9PEZI|nr:putative tubulin--tyrosine ligase pby1 [Cladosporium sp. JES 115]
MSSNTAAMFYALIDYEDQYVQPLIISAVKSQLPSSSYKLITSLSDYPSAGGPLLQWRAYESLVFEFALEEPCCLVNSYIIRKALIRKHYLSTTVSNWVTKHPDSVLKKHVKPSVDFELDYAEFLDDALVEAYELRESCARNESELPKNREWWILKPGMSDRGQGIRLFSLESELEDIFRDWEAEQPDSDDETEHSDSGDAEETETSGVITSQLRHFVAQPYIHPPLTFSEHGHRKFHVRTYVLAVGSLMVYVYKPMLALFAADPYVPPWNCDPEDLRAHLTNTCLQSTGEREGSVRSFWELPDYIPGHTSASQPNLGKWKDAVFTQICAVTGEVFEAAARGMSIHFQTLPSAFEIFGLDFLVDAKGVAWLLEVNAFPDFRQTGDELKGLVQGLFEEVVDVAVAPFFGVGDEGKRAGSERMVRVLDIDLGRR